MPSNYLGVALKEGAGFTKEDHRRFLEALVRADLAGRLAGNADPSSSDRSIAGKAALRTDLAKFLNEKYLERVDALKELEKVDAPKATITTSDYDAYRIVENSLTRMGKGEFTALEKAEDFVGVAEQFLIGAEKLGTAIRAKRSRISKREDDQLDDAGWQKWIAGEAERLGLDPEFTKRPRGVSNFDINKQVEHLKDSVEIIESEVTHQEERANELRDVRDVEITSDQLRKDIELISSGRPTDFLEILSPREREEAQVRFEDVGADAAPAVKLFAQRIGETIPGYRPPAPGELDVDPATLSPGTELTASEREREFGLREELREEAQAAPEMESAAIEAQQAADLEEAAIEQERALAEDFAAAEFDVGGEARGDETLDPDGRKGIDDDTRQYIIDNFSLAGFLLQLPDGELSAEREIPPGSGNMVQIDNVMAYINENGLTNQNEIKGLFLQTQWYNNTEPEHRKWQSLWYGEGGEGFQTFAESNANQRALLDDKMDSIRREAERLGLNLDEEDLWKLAYEAQSMGFDTYEIREQFTSTYEDALFASDEGRFEATRNDIRDEAAQYMDTWTDVDLDDAAKRVYLGQTTIEEIEAGIRAEAKAANPALASLIDQGYTPKMYFASYKKEAENLLERNVDFLGGDRGLYNQLTGTEWDTEGARPMTRAEFGRTLRATPEWQYTDNARDSAYDAASQIARMFGGIG